MDVFILPLNESIMRVRVLNRSLDPEIDLYAKMLGWVGLCAIFQEVNRNVDFLWRISKC